MGNLPSKYRMNDNESANTTHILPEAAHKYLTWFWRKSLIEKSFKSYNRFLTPGDRYRPLANPSDYQFSRILFFGLKNQSKFIWQNQLIRPRCTHWYTLYCMKLLITNNILSQLATKMYQKLTKLTIAPRYQKITIKACQANTMCFITISDLVLVGIPYTILVRVNLTDMSTPKRTTLGYQYQ